MHHQMLMYLGSLGSLKKLFKVTLQVASSNPYTFFMLLKLPACFTTQYDACQSMNELLINYSFIGSPQR